MKSDRLYITEAEMEIAKLLWQRRRPTTCADIGAGLAHRHWKPSTIHTLAMNLEKKGIIKSYKSNGKNYYLPYISEFDYRFVVTKDFLCATYEGSIIEMIRVLLCDWDLTRETLSTLQEMINMAEPPAEMFERRSAPSGASSALCRLSFVHLKALLEWIIRAVLACGMIHSGLFISPRPRAICASMAYSASFAPACKEYEDSA